ncbi:MAG: hypothetical protein K2O32_09455 [Acetatifactor sp.]|nr:hypothetical protein [Acetatifactor sp.]
MFLQRVMALKLWKRRAVRVLAVITILLLLPCIVKVIQPDKIYQCDDGYVFEEGVPTEDTIVYENIALKPGVYCVELYYDAEYGGTGPVAYTTMTDGSVITGGLCTNGEHLYGGADQTSYHLWLYESTDGMQMRVSFGGEGGFQLLGYRITETNQLWSMLITIILFVFLLLLCAFTYHYYNREYPVAEEKRSAFFFVMLIGFLASLPYLYRGNFPGIDITYHMLRIEGVKDGLLGGQFPVRIEPEWVYGHGYAAAVFYCNSLLYFPAILRLLGFPVSVAYNVYCIALTITTAAVAYYCFRRIFQNTEIGLLSSALYTLSTFRLYKLVNTCAVGEGSAVTFMPLILYGMYRVFTEDPKSQKYKTAWVPIAIGYAGLIQTHVLTCEITAFLTILICLVFVRKIFCWNTFLELAKGALAALGLSLWFLVPFLDYYLTQNVHIKNLSARTIQRTGMTPAHLAFHFWRNGIYTPNGETGVYQTHPVGVGLVLIVGLGLFAALWFGGALRRTDKNISRLAVVSALFGGLLLFMSTNTFPWDAISGICSLTATLVSSLEFTHRVLGWGTLFLVTVCGFCLWYLRREGKWPYLMAVAVVIGCVTTSSLYLMDFVRSEDDMLTLYNEEGMGFGFISDGEYLLEGTKAGKLTFEKRAIAGAGVSVSEYAKKYLNVKMSCVNAGGEEGYVEVPLLFYKGYRAFDGAGDRLEVCAGDNHVVRVILPEGFEGTVEVKFVSPLYWRISEVVSILTVLLFALWIWKRQRRAEVC